MSKFSDFFYLASEEEKREVLEKVIKEANEDQQKLIDRVNTPT
jgi:hypothetical protein